MFSRLASSARRGAPLARGLATMAEGKTSRVAQVAVAAGAGVVLAAGVAATQVASAESTAETLANISASLSNIEDAVVYGPSLKKVADIKVSHPNNLAMKHFDFDYFKTLSSADKKTLLAIVNSGIVNFDSGMGCYAMQPADYDKFEPFFGPVMADYHKVPRDKSMLQTGPSRVVFNSTLPSSACQPSPCESVWAETWPTSHSQVP